MPKPLVIAVAALLFGVSAAVAGPLHNAVKHGDTARLKELIAAGEDLADQDLTVGTALHLAALQDDAEAAQLLLEAGSDANVGRFDRKRTPLHVAAERDSVEVGKLLIENGADIEMKSQKQDGPLHIAARFNATRMIALLLESGADPEALNSARATPLMNAAFADAAPAIEVLVGAGANIDAKRFDGKTALHLAAWRGGPDAVRALLELGADVEGLPTVEPAADITPLELAKMQGLDEAVELLRAAGATE